MENNKLKIELLDELDRHLEWIKSCDTKASIVLAMLGVVIVTISSELFLNSQREIVIKVLSNINFSNLIYLSFEVVVYLLFFNGVYNIVRVLFPQLKNSVETYNEVENDSLYYFESISSKTYSEYKKQRINRTSEEEIEDILSQIYINSKISTKKYYFYKKGLAYVLWGILGILVLHFIGIILVKLGGF
ncbi:hypothetical protein N9R04_09765 [Staphylococcus sp. SQ8-PEA]|uniref:Pycsar effector protein domain-containing protein n=1 Tax=Staphylococcus marylandisciuri TaxID=2981529 RepID=A0ABT2QSP1_9STAP|nr:hypothetical protein [Staphylococcus marylandisciuri]MCU5746963.1 hypothetical protein [Staphylococcus marylandisciuri]